MDDFVNGNRPNVDILHRYDELKGAGHDADEIMFEILPGEFAAGLGDVELDHSCDPVYVYLRGGEPVAWYDCENCCGYR
jgi:hypothetical protein